MKFWILAVAIVVFYTLAWDFFLEPLGFDKNLYVLIVLLLSFFSIRIYWKIGWGGWIYPREYLWIPYYAVCAYFLVSWIA